MLRCVSIVVLFIVSLGASALNFSDPETINTDFPPGVMELAFASDGSNLNATYYLANGEGPHPTVVLLHGFPGYEKNLDLAQALRREGLNVLFPHYRGSWGSEGEYSFVHVVEDVQAAIDALRANAKEYRVAPDRIILIGHSVGGFAALAGAANDTEVACVAALAPANPAVWAQVFADPENAQRRAGLEGYIDGAGPIRGLSGKAMVDEVIAHADALNTFTMGKRLGNRPVLVVAASKDTVLPPPVYFDPLVSALMASNPDRVSSRLLDGDHAFSWTRITLMETVLDWTKSSCLNGKGK